MKLAVLLSAVLVGAFLLGAASLSSTPPSTSKTVAVQPDLISVNNTYSKACVAVTTCNMLVTLNAYDDAAFFVSGHLTVASSAAVLAKGSTAISVFGGALPCEPLNVVTGTGGGQAGLLEAVNCVNLTAGAWTFYVNMSTSHTYDIYAVEFGLGSFFCGTAAQCSTPSVLNGSAPHADIVNPNAPPFANSNCLAFLQVWDYSGTQTLTPSVTSPSATLTLLNTSTTALGGTAREDDRLDLVSFTNAKNTQLFVNYTALSGNYPWDSALTCFYSAFIPKVTTSLGATFTGSNFISLTWKNAIGPFISQKLYQATYSSACGNFTTVYNITPYASTFNVTNLTAGTYCFYEKNGNTTGLSNASATIIVSTFITGGGFTLPAPFGSGLFTSVAIAVVILLVVAVGVAIARKV